MDLQIRVPTVMENQDISGEFNFCDEYTLPVKKFEFS